MLLPLDMRDWLPEDHMVHFILEVVEEADTSGFSVNKRGTGSKQYPPSMLWHYWCIAIARVVSALG
jgi:transposase